MRIGLDGNVFGWWVVRNGGSFRACRHDVRLLHGTDARRRGWVRKNSRQALRGNIQRKRALGNLENATICRQMLDTNTSSTRYSRPRPVVPRTFLNASVYSPYSRPNILTTRSSVRRNRRARHTLRSTRFQSGAKTFHECRDGRRLEFRSDQEYRIFESL